MHPDLHLRAVLRDDREKLDAVAEVGRVLDVGAVEIADTLDLHLVHARLEAVRERGEDARLVGGVEAVDVERGVRLRVAELLRVLEDAFEREPLVLHPGQDVVARTVENAVYGLDLVSGEPFAQHADDRDAAAYGGAKVDVDVVLRRRLEYLAPVLGEQLLVRRDHALPVAEGLEHKRLRDARPADCLDDDVDLRVGKNAFRVCRENAVGNLNAAVRRDVEVRDLPEDDVDAEALRHDVTMLQKAVSDSRADGSEAKNSYSYLLHLCIWPFFFVCPYAPRISKRHVVYRTGIFRKIGLGGSGNGLGRRAVRIKNLDLEAGEVGEILDLALGIRPLAAVDGKANLRALSLANRVEHGGGVLLERERDVVGPL